MKCEICGKENKSMMGLAHHVTRLHKIDSQEYFDKYIGKEKEGDCVICGSPTIYLNMTKGYRPTCSSKCGCIFHRKNLKMDEEKTKKFSDKVSNNQKNIWKKRKETGEDKIILGKAGKKHKERNKLLTKEELKEKYGWLNKLEGEERIKKISLITEGMFNYHKNCTERDIQKIVKKRLQTRIERGNLASEEDKKDIKLYSKRVRNRTEIVYRENIDIIDPERKRGVEFHLDHNISIQFGYLNAIDPCIISDVNNLRIITAKENMTKHAKCQMEIEFLMELINNG